MPNVAAEFEKLLKVDVEREVPDGPDDFVTKAMAASLHEEAGGNPAKLDAETSVIHKRAEGIHKAIAADAATKTTADASRLTKGGERVVRTEVTRYSSNREVIAEIGEDGSVLRTYEKTNPYI